MLTAVDYQPPNWLRNPHIQSVLGSSPLRRRRGERNLAVLGAVTQEHLVDGGDGVRLQGLPVYLWYFEKKWRGSLARKRELFPHLHAFDDRVLGLRMRPLTQWLVERHTDFGTLENYFDGYSIAGQRLAGLQVPASSLMAADDPVIPVESFAALALPASARLEISPWGGHCGFLENAHLDGFAERWIAQRMVDAL